MKPSKHYVRCIHLLRSPDHLPLQSLVIKKSLIMAHPPMVRDQTTAVPTKGRATRRERMIIGVCHDTYQKQTVMASQ